MFEWHTWYSDENEEAGKDDRPGHTIKIKDGKNVENTHRKMWTAEANGETKSTRKF